MGEVFNTLGKRCVVAVVGGVGQRSNDASAKDAQIMLNKERCAQRMGQSANFVTVMDGQIKLSEVGGLCVRHGAKRKRCSSEG